MPYVAQRPLTCMGVRYTPGEQVPAGNVPSRSLRSLLGRGYLVELDESEYEAAEKSRVKRTRVAAGG